MSKEKMPTKEEILSFLSQDATEVLQESNNSIVDSIISFIERNVVYEDNSENVDHYLIYIKKVQKVKLLL